MDREEEAGCAKTGLREGWSTGACATAACLAAWIGLRDGSVPSEVRVLFPDGKERGLKLAAERCRVRSGVGEAALVKDGGDDPDCTHGAVIYARLRLCEPGEQRPEDYVLSAGGGVVLLRGIEGIGLCTRPGLDCEPGKWAVNIVPRRMIAENLGRAGLDAGCVLAELGIEDGESLALKTLNPQLGIAGGLSVLGTTGIVRPYSHEAYLSSVRLCVRSHALSGGSAVVFCTGGRTRNGARRALAGLPETAFVSMGDFIAESLSAAAGQGMRNVVVACMPGKLCKYAAGLPNTHAHTAGQDLDLLRREARCCLPGCAESAVADCVSVREALERLPRSQWLPLLRRLAWLALRNFRRWHPESGGPGDFHLENVPCSPSVFSDESIWPLQRG